MVLLAQAAGSAPCYHPCGSAPSYHPCGSAPCYHPSWVAPRATSPSGVWLAGARLHSAHRAALARSLAPWRPRGSEPWHEQQDGALQAAGALHPASMCSVCSAVHRSSLSEIGLEMCVPMFLAP